MDDKDDDYERSTAEMRQQADVMSAQQTQDANERTAKQQWDAGDISYHGFKDLEAKEAQSARDAAAKRTRNTRSMPDAFPVGGAD